MEEKKIQEWIDIAEEDLSTAELCINGGKKLWAMVMCQQAIEKILKAIYLKQTQEVPPQIHNLKLLFDKIGLLKEIDNETDTLLEALLSFYLGSRYPDKRQRLISECTDEYARLTYDKTQQVIIWLKSKL